MKHHGLIDALQPSVSKNKNTITVCLYFLAITLLWLSCLVISILAFNAAFMPSYEKVPVWFQRSGSLVTAFALYSDFLIQYFKSYSETCHNDKAKFYPVDSPLHSVINVTHYIALTVAIYGTVIWGYGDVIYIELFSKS
jgi:hypothetical protein